jgi:hypothetical protein
MDKEKVLQVLDIICKDMEKDAKEMDGLPFNGKTVGKYYGYQAAAIKTLSEIIKTLIRDGNN